MVVTRTFRHFLIDFWVGKETHVIVLNLESNNALWMTLSDKRQLFIFVYLLRVSQQMESFFFFRFLPPPSFRLTIKTLRLLFLSEIAAAAAAVWNEGEKQAKIYLKLMRSSFSRLLAHNYFALALSFRSLGFLMSLILFPCGVLLPSFSPFQGYILIPPPPPSSLVVPHPVLSLLLWLSVWLTDKFQTESQKEGSSERG